MPGVSSDDASGSRAAERGATELRASSSSSLRVVVDGAHAVALRRAPGRSRFMACRFSSM